MLNAPRYRDTEHRSDNAARKNRTEEELNSELNSVFCERRGGSSYPKFNTRVRNKPHGSSKGVSSDVDGRNFSLGDAIIDEYISFVSSHSQR
jgi:hypothetical protein